MKKIFSILTIVVLFVFCSACETANSHEESIKSYANEAKSVLLDYDKSLYADNIDKATTDAIDFLQYCETEEDFNTIESWHKCVVLYICSNQILDYSYEMYNELKNQNSYYFSQKTYLESQINEINAKYDRAIRNAPEYIETMVGRPDPNLIQQYISRLNNERAQKIGEIQRKINALNNEYSPILSEMDTLYSLNIETQKTISLCESEFEELNYKANQIKNR